MPVSAFRGTCGPQRRGCPARRRPRAAVGPRAGRVQKVEKKACRTQNGEEKCVSADMTPRRSAFRR